MVLRDIPVYEGWVVDSCLIGHNVDEFVVALQDIMRYLKEWLNVKRRLQVAESRSIDDVAQRNLLKPTKSIGIKCVSGLFRYLFSTGILVLRQYSHTEDS